MKAKQNTKSGAITSCAKSIRYNCIRARARASVNVMLGLVTAGEAGQSPPVVRQAARGWSNSPAWIPSAIYRAGAGAAAERRGFAAAASAAAATVATDQQAARDCATRARDAIAAAVARAAGNGAALARLHRLAELGGAGVELRKGALVVAPVMGAAAMVAASCAAIGAPDSGRRAAIFQAQAAAKRAIGKGWHSSESAREQVRLRSLLAAETLARGARLLRSGLLGRASARAARIGWAMGRRWLRGNSRREALAVAEIGAAAGVDDKQAGDDWAAELQAIAGAVHLRAAAYGVAMVAAPLPACSAIVARGYSGGLVSSLRSAVLGRGRRVDGLPVVEWSDKGRQVAADSIGTIGRGCVWLWAARIAGREMHTARYGRGGRDGREVAADWSILGSVRVRPFMVAPSRRPSVVVAVRDELALRLWSARRGVEVARRAALAAVGPVARLAAGSMLGAARMALDSATDTALLIGRAMAGRSVPSHQLARWVESDADGVRLTPAGRTAAKRLRKSLSARLPLLVPVRRVAVMAGALAGDELADETSAPLSF